MLRITLYQGCCLNDKYQVVFSHKVHPTQGSGDSYLDRYLFSLQKISFDLDNVYYENSGTINFDMELIDNNNIYKYNYMKCELFDEDNVITLTRYCFIDDIAIQNEIVYLEYSEDIYSSYANKIKGCLPSYMSRKRYNPLGFSPTYNLPVEYNSNNHLLINQLETLDGLYVLYAQVQYYDIDSAGNATYRSSAYCKVRRFADNVYVERNSLYETFRAINRMKYLAQLQKFHPSNNPVAVRLYYEVSDFIVIPSVFYEDYDFDSQFVNFGTIHDENDNEIYSLEYLGTNITTTAIYTKSLTNNFKCVKIGTPTQNFDIINNGTDIKIKLDMWYDRYSLFIYLCVNNAIIDITESFKVNLPFSYLNSEVIAQEKLQRELATANGVIKIGTGVIQTGLDIATGVGAGISLLGSGSKTVTTKIRSKTKSGNMKWRTVSKNERGTTSGLDLASDITSGAGRIATGITGLIEANAPVYSTSKGIFGNCDSVSTLRYGLIYFEVYPDNTDFVKKSCNETGYVIYGYVDNSNIDRVFADPAAEFNASYDVVQFESANFYGEFPNFIADKLNEIFESGVKINYSPVVNPTDNYFVG